MNSLKQVINTRPKLGFILYDFANSAYILIFNSYLFPLFIKDKYSAQVQNIDFLWGLLLSISLVIALITSPFIGNWADNKNERRYFLAISVMITISGLLLLSFIPYENIYIYSTLFIITNCVFTISLSLYDSLISHVSNHSERNKLSGLAWGFGYLGGVVCLILIMAISNTKPESSRIGFLITSIFFALSSFVSLFLMKDLNETGFSVLNSRGNNTIPKILFRNKHFLILLCGIWLISEGIDIVIYFTSLFGSSTLGITKLEIGKLLLLVQILAFPLTWLMTILSEKYSSLKILNLCVLIWSIVLVGFFFSSNYFHFTIITILTSFVIGTTQALLRGEYSKLMPEGSSSFYFGAFSILTRSANIIGPLLFGLLSSITGSQKMGLLLIFLFFIIGIYFYNIAYKKLYSSIK